MRQLGVYIPKANGRTIGEMPLASVNQPRREGTHCEDGPRN
jgi:hypothetical protein